MQFFPFHHPFECFFLQTCPFECFFLQTCLGTWDRISSTCNIIKGLLKHHSMASQFFMRCLTLPNYMIFNEIHKKRFVWIGGTWWNGIEWSDIELCSIVWICKKWMEWNGTWWNSFHPIPPSLPIFHSIQFGVYAMEWDFLIL